MHLHTINSLQQASSLSPQLTEIYTETSDYLLTYKHTYSLDDLYATVHSHDRNGVPTSDSTSDVGEAICGYAHSNDKDVIITVDHIHRDTPVIYAFSNNPLFANGKEVKIIRNKKEAAAFGYLYLLLYQNYLSTKNEVSFCNTFAVNYNKNNTTHEVLAKTFGISATYNAHGLALHALDVGLHDLIYFVYENTMCIVE